MQRKNSHLRFSKLSKDESKKIESQILDLICKIRKRREELELSQEQLAERLNLSLGTIRSVERNVRTPSLVTFIRISTELGLKISLFDDV